MHIVVHDYAGHPFPVQLSRELAARGHEIVHLYAGYNQTPRGSLSLRHQDPPTFKVSGVFIRKPLDKDSLFRRWLQEKEYGRRVSLEIRRIKPDILISANTPLDAQQAILTQTRREGAKLIFWLQDFIGIATRMILRKRASALGDPVGGYYIWLERRLLKKSDAIVTISEDFYLALRSWGIAEAKIELIPNWAPLEELPVCPKSNPWSKSHWLHEGFNFLYTGTLRMKHNPALLLELAKSLHQDTHDAKLVVASEGPGAEWLREQAQSLGLFNVRILKFQPMRQYSEVLATADVLVAILEKEAGAFSVPSKVLSYLCANRPLLLAVPKENLAARIVEQNKAGIVVEPDDFDGFLRGARALMSSADSRHEMGANSRSYAEATFDITRIADRFEELLARL